MSEPQKLSILHVLAAHADEETLERLQAELGAWRPDAPQTGRRRQTITMLSTPKTDDATERRALVKLFPIDEGWQYVAPRKTPAEIVEPPDDDTAAEQGAGA